MVRYRREPPSLRALSRHFADVGLQILEPLGIENQIIGFIFLIDANCKVRWAGNGEATDKEVQSLRESTAVLLKRMEGPRADISKPS